MRIAPAIVLSEPQRVQLTGYARGRKVPLRVSQRAKILLLASDGKQNEEIARALVTSPPTVARWRLRFIQQGVAGIETDAPRPGRNPSISSETVQEIVRNERTDLDSLSSRAGLCRGRDYAEFAATPARVLRG